MLEKIPTGNEMEALLGAEIYGVWQAVCELVDGLYEMDRLWDRGGKRWTYEYKYRRGGKTLCTLYAREGCFGLLIIFGKDERAKFEGEEDTFSPAVREAYHSAKTYHDGKWLLLELTDLSLMGDIEGMLRIKRRPNRK